MTRTRAFRELAAAEQTLMNIIWAHGPATADACREHWPGKPISDSTVRTMLRRMEAKGYLTHELAGRAFVYRAREARESVAVRAVRQLLERFCGGSAEALLAGMVRHQVVAPGELARIARRLAAADGKGRQK